jgi:hypothetical protein
MDPDTGVGFSEVRSFRGLSLKVFTSVVIPLALPWGGSEATSFSGLQLTCWLGV